MENLAGGEFSPVYRSQAFEETMCALLPEQHADEVDIGPCPGYRGGKRIVLTVRARTEIDIAVDFVDGCAILRYSHAEVVCEVLGHNRRSGAGVGVAEQPSAA
ncbi:hypothetical protein [Streptomyces sp. TRM49041]|uniref:hypothetical protein n=1 Tax=Streptomyces sp. TRM49041 TaxID=2603216 RepID=UPI0016568846|nr:hypothetical protein [Streptomyces sp. TRM49041]